VPRRGRFALPAGPSLSDPQSLGSTWRPDRGLPGARDPSGRTRRSPCLSGAKHRRGLPQPRRNAHSTMTTERTYLDWNATAPLLPEARAAIERALDVHGNPSSVHAEGRRARAIVETAREQVAALVGARPSEVVFTSGATEACNTVLRAGWNAVLRAGVEHDAVLKPADGAGSEATAIAIDGNGVVDLAALDQQVRAAVEHHGIGRALIALQIANNETGV